MQTRAEVREATRSSLKATVPELGDGRVAAMERGVWNWALREAASRDNPRQWDDALCDDYCRRAAHCAANLSRGALGNGNKYLLDQVLAGAVEPYDVPFLDAVRLNPPLLEGYAAAKAKKDAYDRSGEQAASALFECPSCGAHKATYLQLQTRSGDEGSTVFLTCLECGHKWTDTP